MKIPIHRLDVALARDRHSTEDAPVTTRLPDLFTIGIGPGSGRTVGPMRAAKRFVDAHRRRLTSRP
jgi:hypothetical protein